MTDWISARVQEEQNRIEQINAFRKATNTFLAALEEQGREAVTEYGKHFHDARFDVTRNRIELKVVGWQEDHGTGLSLRAFGDPITRQFIFHISPSETRTKVIPASVHGETLRLDITAHGISNENVIEYMLMPILFPGLVNDAGLLGYLQKQFRPR